MAPRETSRPGGPGPEGVRVERLPGATPGRVFAAGAAAIAAVGAVALLLLWDATETAPSPPRRRAVATLPPTTASTATQTPTATATTASTPTPTATPTPPAPDPEAAPPPAPDAVPASSGPTGVALYPPPGSKPIQRGIVVPEDFELPPGYVRHHQATDDGRLLPGILKFHPDHVPRDADGNPIPIPEDRVVPPELAPPGLPVRYLEVDEPTDPAPEPPPER